MVKKNTTELKANEEPVVIPASKAKEEAIKLVEAYKKQSPWKYELKKVALQEWIDSL